MRAYACPALTASPWGDALIRALEAALAAVDPAAAVLAALAGDAAALRVAGRDYHLGGGRRVWLVGAGKAGAPMARAAAARLGASLAGGLVIVKEGHAAAVDPRVQIIEAGHPVPDQRGVAATRQLLALLATVQPQDLVIALLSGGGSALLTDPAGTLSLDDLQALTAALLASGATINEINTLRKHLDRIKGGGLARQVNGAELVTLVLSDVVGDPLEVIASGPTVPDPTTFAAAAAILDAYGLRPRLPLAIAAHLDAGLTGAQPETPKLGDPIFAHTQTVIVGANRQAAQAAAASLRRDGLGVSILTNYLQGEAAQVGGWLASLARQLATYDEPLPRPAVLLLGGETTVTLGSGPVGRGGRNQEIALAAALGLAGLDRVAVLTFATDGGDGPTDAAGAFVSGATLAQAHARGLDPAAALRRHDAYPLLAALGALLRPGPTQTNVNDLAFVLAW
jgi:hydroxypyruvate reductase